MDRTIAFIGFGEAAGAFAPGLSAHVRAYDRKTTQPDTRGAKLADYAMGGIDGTDSAEAALNGAQAVLSLVTADQALAVATDYARFLDEGALWLDLNSVAPETKRAAVQTVEAAGGRYVDVAVLSPVYPARLAVPLLASGPHAEEAAGLLRAIGFTKVNVAQGGIGKASSIKMIRSVMVKGLEALTAEWILAAEAAGIREEAVAALNASWPGVDWAEKADYNLERMMVHGIRRAEEMKEVVKTLDGLGTGSAMTRGTVARQSALGTLHEAAPDALDAKLALLLGRKADVAAG